MIESSLIAARKSALAFVGVWAFAIPIVSGMLSMAPQVSAQSTVTRAGADGSAQSSRPRFEVASIKRNMAGRPPSPITRYARPGGRFVATNLTLSKVIQFVHRVQDVQVIGGPDWVRNERFDINATAGREVPEEEIRLMVQSLLEDRFRLVVRPEQREMPIHEVLLSRSDGRVGPNMIQLSPRDECETIGEKLRASPGYQKPPAGTLAIRGQGCGPASSIFSEVAFAYVRTPVVDKTGLTGIWAFATFFGPDTTMPSGNGLTGDMNLPSFFTSWQEQLGLKLRSTRGLVDVLTIESVQQPTEN